MTIALRHQRSLLVNLILIFPNSACFCSASNTASIPCTYTFKLVVMKMVVMLVLMMMMMMTRKMLE